MAVHRELGCGMREVVFGDELEDSNCKEYPLNENTA